MASTKSRQFIWSGRINLAKMQAEHARKRAVEAAREADRAEAEGMVSANGRLRRPGTAFTNDRPVHQRRSQSVGSRMQSLRNQGEHRLKTHAAHEDPMKSKGLGRWLQGDLHPPR
jgi:hypothetical protein